MKAFFQNNKWTLTVALLQVLLIALCFATADANDMRLFFNSDTLYLPSIYRDLFVDGSSLEGWFINPAPNLFPDVVIYFALQGFTGDFVITSILFSFFQYAFIALLIHRVFRIVLPHADDFRMALIHLSIGLIYIVSVSDDDFGFSFQLLSNAYHMGVFVNILLALWMFLIELNKPSIARKILLVLCIVVFGFSDKIFWIGFSFPVLIIAALMFFGKKRREAIVLFGITALATWVSALLLKQFESGEYFTVEKPFRYMDFANIGNSWNIMYDQLSTYVLEFRVKGLIIILTFVAVVFSMIQSTRVIIRYFKSTERLFGNDDVLHIFFMLFAAAVFWAPVINGNYGGWDTIRYNFPVFVFALVYLAAQIPDLRFSIKKIGGYVLMGVAGLSAVVLVKNNENWSMVVNYYPRKVRLIDEIAAENKLEYGVAGHWDSKLTTMFSKRGLRVYSTFEDFNPYLHVVNHNWFFEKIGEPDQAPVYSFIVIDDEKQIVKAKEILGPDCFIVQKEDIRVLITPPFIIDRGNNKAVKITDLK